MTKITGTRALAAVLAWGLLVTPVLAQTAPAAGGASGGGADQGGSGAPGGGTGVPGAVQSGNSAAGVGTSTTPQKSSHAMRRHHRRHR